MKLYENYINSIKNVIEEDKARRSRVNYFDKSLTTSPRSKEKFITESKVLGYKPMSSLEPLMNKVGRKEFTDQKLGEHPDFKYLKDTLGSEYHYITSVFIDIKNSTGLFRKYDPNVIYIITNTIQRAAIHTCVIFGGYIHRLQGDGLFVYFGGKDIEKNDSARNALAATSMFTYFVKNDLKKLFLEEGIENIYTRIGVDFGDDQDVLWSIAGIGECSEVTTTSLHTSLASKMQAIANSNSIVVGDNIKSISGIDQVYFDWVKDSSGEIKQRYIFEDKDNSFYYKALDFKWHQYLKSLPYIVEDIAGELFFEQDEDKTEKKRLNELSKTSALLDSGSAYTSSAGIISGEKSSVRNQPHRFHF